MKMAGKRDDSVVAEVLCHICSNHGSKRWIDVVKSSVADFGARLILVLFAKSTARTEKEAPSRKQLPESTKFLGRIAPPYHTFFPFHMITFTW